MRSIKKIYKPIRKINRKQLVSRQGLFVVINLITHHWLAQLWVHKYHLFIVVNIL